MVPKRLALHRSIPWLLFIFFAGFYLLTSRGVISEADGIVSFAVTRSLVETRSLAVSCDISTLYVRVGLHGRCYSKYDIGLAVLAVPLYLVGRLFREPAPANPEFFSLPKLFVSTLNQFVTAATCAVLYSFAFKFSNSRQKALELTLLYGLATIAWPYASTHFSQPLIGLLLLYVMMRLSEQKSLVRGDMVIVGLLLAFASLVRLDSLPLIGILLIFAFYRLSRHIHSIHHYTLYGLTLILPLFLALLAQLALSYIRSGGTVQIGYAGEGWTTPFWQGFTGLLFSPGRSLFLYSPLTLLAFPGLFLLRRQGHSPLTNVIALLFVIQLATYASWWAWDGGWVWGPRFLISTLPLLMLGLLPWLEPGFGQRMIVIVLATMGFIVQLPGVMVDPLTYILRSPVAYSQLLYTVTWSPLVGHFQELWQRRVSLLVTSQAYGVLNSTETVIWVVVCLAMMLSSGWFLFGESKNVENE